MQGNLNFVQTIRDPVHGPIPITDLEVELLQTQCVGKLRWIKQMGLAFFCFPGANHTRFEHSIGAMHIAYLIFDRLLRSKNIASDEHQAVAEHMQDFRLAALFHDLGHAPFSHTLEEFFERYPEYNPKEAKFHSHEYYTKTIIRNNVEIKNIFSDWKKQNSKEIDVDFIANLSIGKNDIFGTLFSGSLDVDRLDYLMRDNYYCGLPFGSIDLSSLIAGLTFKKIGRNYRVFFSQDSISYIEGFLTSKFQLARTVFNHPKNRSMSLRLFKMLKSAYDTLLQETRQREKTLERISYLIHNVWTDYDVFYFVENPIETWKIHEKRIAEKYIVRNGNETEVDQTKGTKLSRILKGDSPELAYAINATLLSPEDKYNLNLLALSPYYQRKLSERIRWSMSCITHVKIEPYDIKIRMEGKTRNINQVSPIVESLVNSCLDETRLTYYSTKKIRDMPIPTEEARQIVNKLRESRGNKPFGTDLILLVTYYLQKWIEEERILPEKHLFFQADTRLQAFFAEVTRGLRVPYESLIDLQNEFEDLATIGNIIDKCFEFYNLRMQADLDILTRLGLMYRRVAIVGIESSYYPRVERRISRHGRNYVQNTLTKELPLSMRETARKQVTDLLNDQRKTIVECLRIESGGTPVERGEMAEKKKDYLVCLGG